MRILPLGILALGFALGAAAPRAGAVQEPPPPPPPPAKDPVGDAEAEAAAARKREAEAAAEARILEQKARRLRRKALEKDLSEKEEALDAARARGDAAAVAKAEREVQDADRALLFHLAEGIRAVPPPVAPRPARQPRPPAPYDPGDAIRGLPVQEPVAGRTVPQAIEDGLDWLARHQRTGGNWDGDGDGARCEGAACPGSGNPLYDVGLTGLALSAFIGAGETHKTPRHGAVVRAGLKFLKGVQDQEGCFGPRTSSHFTYNHALATLAMVNAEGLTQSPLFRSSARSGVEFALACRNPYLAWRYGVRPGDNDTSVTSWMLLALASAKQAGLEVDEQAFQGTVAWLDKVTEPDHGRAGYTARGNGPARPQELMDAFPADRTEALTAAAVTLRLLCGQGAEHPLVRKGLDLCGRSLPAWSGEGTIDFYYWYFGSIAFRRTGGDGADRWEKAVLGALLPMQRAGASGCARGSWDPADPWGPDGGRVYATALNTMTLQLSQGYRRAEGGK